MHLIRPYAISNKTLELYYLSGIFSADCTNEEKKYFHQIWQILNQNSPTIITQARKEWKQIRSQ